MQAVTEQTTLEALKADFSNTKQVFNAINELYLKKKASLDETLSEITSEWECRHEEFLRQHANAKLHFEEAEQDLREAVVEKFNETGVKTIDEHLSVRVSKKLSYDNDAAVAWAETNAPIVIRRTVDKKSFEAFAETNPSTPDGESIITVTESTTAVISSKL